MTTWNPDDKAATITLTEGNLKATFTISFDWKSVRATDYKSAGKWYWEVTIGTVTSDYNMVGVGTAAADIESYCGDDDYGYGYMGQNGYMYHSTVGDSYGATYTTNDIIGVALDLDNGKIWFSKNGVWQNSGDPIAGTGEAYSGLSGDFYPMGSLYTVDNSFVANFGSSSFAYSVPTGFLNLEYAYAGYFSGYVYDGEDNTISGAIIYLYRSDDGFYIDTTTSSDDGGFYVETTYSGSHFLVCLYPPGSEIYNDLIYGSMYPITVSG